MDNDFDTGLQHNLLFWALIAFVFVGVPWMYGMIALVKDFL